MTETTQEEQTQAPQKHWYVIHTFSRFVFTLFS